jgi:hypothetical protein
MTDNSNPFYSVDEQSNTATINDGSGGVSQVTASVTISAKPLGGDAFVKLEETFTFATPVDEATAIYKRDEIIDILREQAILKAQETADSIRAHIASNPRGNVSVHPVAPAAAPAAQAGVQAPAFGAAATVAVANGATPAPSSGLQWGSVKSRFGEGELRFVTTASQSSDELKSLVLAEMQAKGLNPDALVVWDNRTGAKGLEAGVPAGCVAAVKVSKEAQEFVPVEVQNIALARVKHNSNGSVYVWLTKEAESALKFGALDRIKVA